MKARAAVLLLILCTASLDSQSVILTEQLRPFRINRVMVTDLQDFQNPRVEITGRTVYDREIPLFCTSDSGLPEQLEWFLYFDDSVQEVRIQISFSAREPVAFAYSTELNPYELTVFCQPRQLPPPLPGYRFTSSIRQLGKYPTSRFQCQMAGS